MLFRNRSDAGRQLAAKLTRYADRRGVLVLALPRGGVPVAFEVARMLRAPLDVFLVRKLGVPGQEELAMGAIATGDVRVLNEQVVRSLRISEEEIETVAVKERHELNRRERLYRGVRPSPAIRGKTVILIDDGLATGATMQAAITALRRQEPGRIVMAVPVGSADVCAGFQEEADESICVHMPEPFFAVGICYGDFSQTTDQEVRDLLERAAEEHLAANGRV